MKHLTKISRACLLYNISTCSHLGAMKRVPQVCSCSPHDGRGTGMTGGGPKLTRHKPLLLHIHSHTQQNVEEERELYRHDSKRELQALEWTPKSVY